MLTNN